MEDRRTVVGVYHTEEDAVRAINNLQNLGYSRDQISVLADKPERFSTLENNADVETKSPNEVAEGAATGAAAGGVIGGLGALIAELGLIAIPGVGPFLAAGPIVATITGLVAGGAIGGAVGALVGLGVKEEDAKIYEQNLKDGDILVLVEADVDRYDEVHSTLYPEDEYTAQDSFDRDNLGLQEEKSNPIPESPIDPNYSYHAQVNNAKANNQEVNTNREFDENRSLHDRMDRDDDGRLDADDLRVNPQDTNSFDPEFDKNSSLHDRMDRDDDGRLDADDLKVNPEDRNNFDREFEKEGSWKDKLDRDNDGKLDFDDLRINPRDTDKYED